MRFLNLKTEKEGNMQATLSQSDLEAHIRETDTFIGKKAITKKPIVPFPGTFIQTVRGIIRRVDRVNNESFAVMDCNINVCPSVCFKCGSPNVWGDATFLVYACKTCNTKQPKLFKPCEVRVPISKLDISN